MNSKNSLRNLLLTASTLAYLSIGLQSPPQKKTPTPVKTTQSDPSKNLASIIKNHGSIIASSGQPENPVKIYLIGQTHQAESLRILNGRVVKRRSRVDQDFALCQAQIFTMIYLLTEHYQSLPVVGEGIHTHEFRFADQDQRPRHDHLARFDFLVSHFNKHPHSSGYEFMEWAHPDKSNLYGIGSLEDGILELGEKNRKRRDEISLQYSSLRHQNAEGLKARLLWEAQGIIDTEIEIDTKRSEIYYQKTLELARASPEKTAVLVIGAMDLGLLYDIARKQESQTFFISPCILEYHRAFAPFIPIINQPSTFKTEYRRVLIEEMLK